jgi:hypothetical protein
LCVCSAGGDVTLGWKSSDNSRLLDPSCLVLFWLGLVLLWPTEISGDCKVGKCALCRWLPGARGAVVGSPCG